MENEKNTNDIRSNFKSVYGKFMSPIYHTSSISDKLNNEYISRIRIDIELNTDNTCTSENRLGLSQRYSQLLANYFICRGISTKRLVATGIGGTKPIAHGFL